MFFLVLQVAVFFQKLPLEATESMNLMLSLNKKNERIISQKTRYDIGTKILFGASVSRKPIKIWEIENIKT